MTRFHLKDSERYRFAVFPVATLPATILFIVSYFIIFSVVRRTSKTVGQINSSVRNKLCEKEQESQYLPSQEEKEKVCCKIQNI